MAEEMTPAQRDAEMLAVERELSQLLAVDPSPGFAARVRARIDQQPARAFGWRPWLLSSVAVAAVVIVAIVAISRRPAPVHSGDVQAHADVSLPVESYSRPARDSRTAARGPQLPIGEPIPPRRRPVIAREPEVLIDPALARAVRRLAMEQPVLPEVPAGPSLDPVVVEPLRVPDMPEIGTGGSR